MPKCPLDWGKYKYRSPRENIARGYQRREIILHCAYIEENTRVYGYMSFPAALRFRIRPAPDVGAGCVLVQKCNESEIFAGNAQTIYATAMRSNTRAACVCTFYIAVYIIIII